MIAPHVDGPLVRDARVVRRWTRHRDAAFGLIYLMSTLTCMALYVQTLAPSLANDLHWPTYNRTGCAVFLTDLVNAKLHTAVSTTQPTRFNLLAADVISPKNYARHDVQGVYEATYGRHVLFSDMTTLPHAIRALRTTATAAIVTIYAQYCWVDLDRRWDIAHTRARAARCRAKYSDNAASYLETTLRNTDWNDFVSAFGDPWAVTIAHALEQSGEGRRWVGDRPDHSLCLSLADEVAFHMDRNITRFVTQYQNDFSIAVTETIDLENALTTRQALVIKSTPFDRGSWTTASMYWNFQNDLYIMQEMNHSLVRGDAAHFEQFGYDISAFYGFEYSNQYGVFYDKIGPFGSVDVLYAPLPPPVQILFAAIQHIYSTTMYTNATQIATVLGMPSLVLSPRPPNFAVGDDVAFYGGNALCLDNPPTRYPQAQFAIDDPCTQVRPLTIIGTPLAVVFALAAANGREDIDAICTIQPSDTVAACIACLSELVDAVGPSLLSGLSVGLADAISTATEHVHQVQFIQYAQRLDTAEWLLLEQPLVVSTNKAWSFYGWLAIFDWMEGRREVVRLEGDIATVSMMSEAYSPVQVPATSQAHDNSSGPQTVLYLVVWTTCISVGVGVIVVVYAAKDRLAYRGRHLAAFHHVASFVWVGRPLLLLRGLTAVLMLSTTTTQLVRDSFGFAKFIASPRTVWEVVLVSGESTWVACVVCDVVLIGAVEWAPVFAPLACALAWVATAGLEFCDPISMDVVLQRQCTLLNTNRGVDCTTGVVRSGRWHRVVVLLTVQVASVVLAIVLAGVWKRRGPSSRSRAPLLLYGAAEAFFWTSQDSVRGLWHLDDVACVLTGLLPLSIRGRQYTFDVKLWVLIEDHARCLRKGNCTMSLQIPAFSSTQLKALPTTFVRVAKRPVKQKVMALGGVVAVALSAAGSVSYIAVSTVNFANDFFWATFNMTGHHVVIADWFNQQIMVRGRLSALRLDERRWTTWAKYYANPKVTVSSSHQVGTTLQLTHTTKLAPAIAGLRQSDPCQVPWISTQYCWVDFKRRWPMANSAERQRRCLAADAANGAVYLEAVLRNVDWSVWATCWGHSFTIAVANEVQSTLHGQAWLRDVASAMSRHSLVQEADVWLSAGVDRYVPQWQNYKKLGLVNTYMIENALGIQYPMTLSRSNGSYYLASQTSFKMYWGFASDLWAIGANATLLGGKSLVATSANYAFANQSMVDVLLENQTVAAPLYEAFQVVQREIGPFGSIDMKTILCPHNVQLAVATGLDLIKQSLAAHPATATLSFMNISRELVDPVPGSFKRLEKAFTYGGSLLCPDYSKTNINANLKQLTMREFACGQDLGASVYSTQDALVLAAMASQVGRAADAELGRVCWHLTKSDHCQETFMAQTMAYVRTFISDDDMNIMDRLARPSLVSMRQMNATIVQFLRVNSSSELVFGRAVLFDPLDETFDFWSWVYVYDWALGHREVISFAGDVGTVNVLTDMASLLAQSVQAQEVPTTFAVYAGAGVQYVTGVMLGIAGGAIVCIVLSRGRIEGLNMFELNRVAGIVWVGRPLLLLRGLTALCLLSTSTLELVPLTNYYSTFHVPTLPWYTTFLGAGEVTWFVYILNDVLMVWTMEYTPVYAPISSALVWMSCAVLTVHSPVVHHATLDPVCTIGQMDFQLTCHSGVVAIGDVSRLTWLLGIIFACNLVGYAATRLAYRSQPPPPIESTSLLLSSGAKYLFNKTNWIHHDVYYIDTASALLNGLLSVRWGSTAYVMDIKLWRCFVIAIDGDLPASVAYAVPLTD